MKFSAVSLLSASPLALAKAVPAPKHGSSMSDLELRAPVCARQDFQISEYNLDGFVTKTQLAYVTSGLGLCFNICVIINHHANTDLPCTAYTSAVASAVIGIFAYTQRGDTPRDGTSTSNRRDAPVAAVDPLINSFAAHGFDHGEVETVTVKRRDDNDPNTLVEHFVLRDVVHPNTITPADYHFNAFANGTGYLHAIHQSTSTNATGGGLQKRPAVVSRSDTMSPPDLHKEFLQAAQSVAQNWAYDADYFGIGEYFPAMGIDYILVKLLGNGLRIIPERNRFGENYEDVNSCGDMSGSVHDELRKSRMMARRP